MNTHLFRKIYFFTTMTLVYTVVLFFLLLIQSPQQVFADHPGGLSCKELEDGGQLAAVGVDGLTSDTVGARVTVSAAGNLHNRPCNLSSAACTMEADGSGHPSCQAGLLSCGTTDTTDGCEGGSKRFNVEVRKEGCTCTAETPYVCLSNSARNVPARVSCTCAPPPTATEAQFTPVPTPSLTPRPSPTSGPTSTPAPTARPGETPVPTRVPTPTTRPEQPTSTPVPTGPVLTPTPIMACFSPCSNPAACVGAQGGCTVCGPEGRCVPPPTPSPTPLPFSPALCKCDGIESSGIFPGANVSFNAFAKVFGTDTTRATVKDITFSVYESLQNQPNNAVRLAQSGPISAQVISQTPAAIRSKSTWNYTFPANVNKTSLYRVVAQINCVRKVAVGPQNVLAATDQPGWIQSIFNAIGRLFDLDGSTPAPTPAPTSVPTLTQAPSQRNNLQLQTLKPAEELEKSCTLIKFKFNN